MRKLGDLSTQDSEAIFLTDIKSPQREDVSDLCPIKAAFVVEILCWKR